MMRRSAFIPGLAAAADSPLDAAFCQHAPTDAWLSRTAAGTGLFQRGQGRQWIEMVPSGDAFLFKENGRRGDSVQLFHAGRRMWVRLSAGFADWRRDGENDWSIVWCCHRDDATWLIASN